TVKVLWSLVQPASDVAFLVALHLVDSHRTRGGVNLDIHLAGEGALVAVSLLEAVGDGVDQLVDRHALLPLDGAQRSEINIHLYSSSTSCRLGFVTLRELMVLGHGQSEYFLLSCWGGREFNLNSRPGQLGKRINPHRRLRGALPRLLALRLLPGFLLRRGQDRDLVIPDSCDTSLAPSRKVGESAKVALKVAGFAQREVQPRGRHFEGVAWPEV